MRTKPILLMLPALCVAMVAGGCGDDDSPGSEGAGAAAGSATQGGKGGAGGKANGDGSGNAGQGEAGEGQAGEAHDGGSGGAEGLGGKGGADNEGGGAAGAMSAAGMGGSGEGGSGGDSAVCGDNAVSGTEACDDGGSDDDDGCSATCEIERVLDIGHIDLFSVVYDDARSGLVLQVKDGSLLYRPSTAYWEPESVTIDVDPSKAAVQLPDDRFLFIGEVGATVYLLPEGGGDAEAMGVPWPGWESTRLLESLPDGVEPADAASPLKLGIAVVEAPGGVFTFTSPPDELTPPEGRYVNSVDPGADVIPMPTSSHTHTNWVFTAAGDYYLEATPSLATKAHGTLVGPTRTFRFHVGEPLIPAGSSPVLTVQSDPLPPYDDGDTVELTASFEPADARVRIEWYQPGEDHMDGYGIQPEPVPGEHGTALSFTATGTHPDSLHFPVLVNPQSGRIYKQ